MKCTDCNGSRIYIGLGHYNDREACRHCKGSGNEPGGALPGSAATRFFPGVTAKATPDLVRKLSQSQGRFPEFISLRGSVNLLTFRLHFSDIISTDGCTVLNDDSVHWVLLGERLGGTDVDSRLIGWETHDVPEPVVQEYAEMHYLALYQRVDIRNHFRCIWHY